MNPENPTLTVAMISMNEEAAIGEVVLDIRQAAPDAEILIVDSSTDHTPDIANALGCRLIRQFPPRGYGPALLRALLEARGEFIITLDCDGTYPAEAIPHILFRMVWGQIDVLNASRIWRRPVAMPIANYLANWLFAFTARRLFGARVTDLHSGMRGYRRSVIHGMTWDASRPAWPVELLLKPIVAGYRVNEIGIDYRERIGSTTLRRWSSAWWTFKRMWRLWRRR